MAKASAKSQLAGLFNKSRTNPVELDTGGGGNFPDGIEMGVAEITSMTIGYHEDGDHQGQPYFMMRGVARQPVEHKGIKVEGLQDTLIFESLYDTPTRKRKTVQEHMDHVVAVLQDLGLETADLEWEDVESGAVFEPLLAERPHCRFRTWKGDPTPEYPNPRVNVQYKGSTEYNGEAVVGVQEDNTAKAPTAKNAKPEPKPIPSLGAQAAKGEDLDSLGEAAAKDDEAAQDKLHLIAQEHGVNADEIETWPEVVTAIKEAQGQASGGLSPTPVQAAPPEKGDVWYYRPPNSKNAMECEVTAVFPANRTCSLKSLSNKKLFKSISWDNIYETADIPF
jgi:hypothetical protein